MAFLWHPLYTLLRTDVNQLGVVLKVSKVICFLRDRCVGTDNYLCDNDKILIIKKQLMSLPTTKIGDRFGRHQENPQQQQNPQRVFEYSQRLNLEKRELYPPPIRGNKLFCPKANTGTRSHLFKVKNGKMTFVLS